MTIHFLADLEHHVSYYIIIHLPCSRSKVHWAGPVPRWPHLSLVVPNLLVELFSLQTQEVFAGRNDATLGRDGAGGVDVVSGDHTDRDARTLTLGDSLGYLQVMPTKAFTDTT